MAPTEQEELRLTATFIDNASAGVAALRGNIQQLTGGATSQQLEKFKRSQEDMGKQIKQLTDFAIGGERAMIGFIGKFGALGLAATAIIGTLKTAAERMAEINRLSAVVGVPAANIKNVVDQLIRAGASAEEARGLVSQFTGALVDLGRAGSHTRMELIQMGGRYAQQMRELIDQMENAGTIEVKLNLARAAAENVRRNRYEQLITLGKSEAQARADAAAAEDTFYQKLGLNAATMERMHSRFMTMTDEQRKANEEALRRGEEMKRQWDALGSSAEEAGGKMLAAFGPALTQVMNAFSTSLTGVREQMEGMAKARQQGNWFEFLFGKGPAGSINSFDDLGKKLGIDKLRPLTGDQGPTGGAVPLMGGWDDMRASTNIEDVRDRGKSIDENTAQLKKLNDALALMTEGDIRLPGALGPGGGGVPTGGSAPYGSSVGPGTGAGAGSTSPHAMRRLGGDPTGGGTFPLISDGGAAGPAGGGGGATSYGAAAASPQQATARVVADRLRAAGMSESGIAGVMANISEESRFDPTLRHPDQPRWGGEAHFAHGLYQEGGQEWLNYQSWLNKNHPGADWRDPGLQTDFLAENLKKNYPGVWDRLQSGNKEQAAGAFASGYLKPAQQYLNQRLGKFARGVPDTEHYTGPGTPQETQRGRRLSDLRGGAGMGGPVGVTGVGEYHKAGTVTVGGETFHWGSGGAGQGIPYGTYNVDFGGVGPLGRSGWGGRLPPAVAGVTTDASGNTIRGGGYVGQGIEIHSGSSNDLDRLYSQGCFAVAPAEWPKFKEKLLEEAQRQPGGKLRLSVTPGAHPNQARAYIGGAGTIPEASGRQQQSYSPGQLAGDTRATAQVASERNAVDQVATMNHRVEGTGKISVDVNAPPNVHVRALGGGLFKRTEINRQTQMEPARQGPGASVPGAGTAL